MFLNTCPIPIHCIISIPHLVALIRALSIPKLASGETHFLILELAESQKRADQPELGRHSLQAVYRKCTASLLYSVSIKGNSAEDFLEGVMKPIHTTAFHSLRKTVNIQQLT